MHWKSGHNVTSQLLRSTSCVYWTSSACAYHSSCRSAVRVLCSSSVVDVVAAALESRRTVSWRRRLLRSSYVEPELPLLSVPLLHRTLLRHQPLTPLLGTASPAWEQPGEIQRNSQGQREEHDQLNIFDTLLQLLLVTRALLTTTPSSPPFCGIFLCKAVPSTELLSWKSCHFIGFCFIIQTFANNLIIYGHI